MRLLHSHSCLLSIHAKSVFYHKKMSNCYMRVLYNKSGFTNLISNHANSIFYHQKNEQLLHALAT